MATGEAVVLAWGQGGIQRDRSSLVATSPAIGAGDTLPRPRTGVTTGSALDLPSAWVELLKPYRWDWFCTLTFRQDVHPEAASKRFRVFIGRLNRMLYGPRWHRKPEGACYWCCGIERQRRGVIHFHALVASPSKDLNDHLWRSHFAKVWQEMAGYARIERVRSAPEAISYLTKYVTKGGEIDLSPNLGVIAKPTLW